MAEPAVIDKQQESQGLADRFRENPFMTLKGKFLSSPWKESCRHHVKSLKNKALGLSVLLYYGAVVAVFSHGDDGWGVGHSLYFGTVMITTVGYGDFLPKTPELKMATVCLVLFGLSVVVLAFGVLQDIVVSASTARAVGKAHKVGIFDTDRHRRHQRNTTLLITFTYIAFLIVGTVVFGHDFKTHPDSDSEYPFLDGFYLSVITITTVGFGDLYPLSDGRRLFSCFYMLVGIPVQLGAFSLVSNFLLGEAEEIQIRKVSGLLDESAYSCISDFVEEMRAEGIGGYRGQGEGQISRFEFLVFILVQNGVVHKANVNSVMKNFDKLDVSNEGFISKNDVVHIGDGELDMNFNLKVKSFVDEGNALTATETDLAMDAGAVENLSEI